MWSYHSIHFGKYSILWEKYSIHFVESLAIQRGKAGFPAYPTSCSLNRLGDLRLAVVDDLCTEQLAGLPIAGDVLRLLA